MYKLLCMAFDGEFQLERAEFESVEDAWEYSNDIGSKWFFYPFHFVVSDSGKTVVSASGSLSPLEGRRVQTVVKLFKTLSKTEDGEGVNEEVFERLVTDACAQDQG